VAVDQRIQAERVMQMYRAELLQFIDDEHIPVDTFTTDSRFASEGGQLTALRLCVSNYLLLERPEDKIARLASRIRAKEA